MAKSKKKQDNQESDSDENSENSLKSKFFINEEIQ
jgi:hypothetical protein